MFPTGLKGLVQRKFNRCQNHAAELSLCSLEKQFWTIFSSIFYLSIHPFNFYVLNGYIIMFSITTAF